MEFSARFVEWAGQMWPLVGRHLLQATILSLPLFLMALALKRSPAKTRFALLLLASVSFLLPTALSGSLAVALGLDRWPGFPLLERSVQSVPLAASVTSHAVFNATEGGRVATIVTTPWLTPGTIYLGATVIWALGFAYLVGGVFKSRREIEEARFLQRETGEREKAAFKNASGRLKAGSGVSLIITRQIMEPCVAGIRRPTVILPEGLAEKLTDKELEAILTHELAHIRRRDNLVSLLHHLLRAAIWFHPLVWLLHQRMLQERERACDEEVINHGIPTDVYTTAILKVYRFCIGGEGVGTCGAVVGYPVKERVAQIENYEASRGPRLRDHLLVFSSACLLFAFSGAFGLPAGVRTVSAAAPPSFVEIEPRLIREVAAEHPRMALTLAVIRTSGGGLPGGESAAYFWTPVELSVEDADHWVADVNAFAAFLRSLDRRSSLATTPAGAESLITHTLKFEPAADEMHSTLTLQVTRGAEFDPPLTGLTLDLEAEVEAPSGRRVWKVVKWKFLS